MTHSWPRRAAALSALVAVYAASAALARSAAFARAPDLLSVGIALDLTVTSALVVYLLVLRPERRSPAFLVPVFAGGLAMAHAILPAGASLGLWVVAFLGLAVEAGAATLTVLRLRTAVRGARRALRDGASFVAALEAGLVQAVGAPWIAAALAREIGAVRFGVFGWLRRGARTGGGRFSMHRDGRFVTLIGVIVYLLAVETVAVHLLVARASVLAAWVLTATSLYAALWLLGDLHAVRLTPAVIAGGLLRLDVGLRWRLAVPLDRIAGAELVPTAAPCPAADLDVSPSGAPNVLLTLSAPVCATGPLGITRRVSTVAVHVDQPTAFIAALRPDRPPPG